MPVFSVLRLVPPVALALLALALPVRAQTGLIDLRPKFIAGHELRYRMTTHSSGSTSIPTLEDPGADPAATKKPAMPAPASAKAPPAEPDQETSEVVEVRFRVVDAPPDGPATVELIFDAIKVKTRSPLGETSFDSAQPQGKDGDDPAAAALRGVVGTTLTLRIDRDGNITDITGGESLLAGWAGDPATALVSGPGVKQSWGPIFTGRKGTGRAGVGEKWSTSDRLDLSPIGGFTITTESVLSSARAGLATVDFKGRIEPSRESSSGGAGMQIRSASHTGSYRWDYGAGSLRSLTMKQEIEAGGTLGGVEVSTSQKSETSIERLEGRSAQPARPSPVPVPTGKPRGR